MNHKKTAQRACSLLLAALLLLGAVLPPVPAHALETILNCWPDLTVGVGPAGNNYAITKSITAAEYPDAGNLLLNVSMERAHSNLIKVIQIPGLDAVTAKPEDYDLTLALRHRNGNSDTASLCVTEYKTENYYLPVRQTLTAADGRQCPIYIVAVPEIRDYSGADYSQALALYSAILPRVKEADDALSRVQTGVVGGYHTEGVRALGRACDDIAFVGFQLDTNALSGITYQGYESVEAFSAWNLQRNNRVDPTQAAYFMSDVLPWYLEYALQPIQRAELTGARVFGAEAVPAAGRGFLLTLPEGTDWSKVQDALTIETTGACDYTTTGAWKSGSTVLLSLTARDPATTIIYQDIKGTFSLRLDTGEPVISVHALQVLDRFAVIDEANRTISLHLANGWEWTQAPAVEASGTRYVYLDSAGNELAAEGGAVDLQNASVLRLILQVPKTGGTELTYTKDYALHVTRAGDQPSAACDLLAFSLGVQGEQVTIDQAAGTVSVVVPYAARWTDMKASCTVSYEAAVTAPDGEDFEAGPVHYVVTAENGTDRKTYTVAVSKVPPATDNRMQSFTFGTLSGVIDHSAGTVTLELPAGTSTRFAPRITLPEFASVEPASGESQDFSRPVLYTVTAQDGIPRTYTVTVTVSSQQVENPYRAKLQDLLNNIINTYRTGAGDDWEWMNLGIYDNLDGPNDRDGFDIAAEIRQMDLGAGGIMTDIDRTVMMLTARGYDCSALARYNGGQPFTDKEGNRIDDLTASLYGRPTGDFNDTAFTLIALDMGGYAVPSNAVNDRPRMLEYLLDSPFDRVASSLMGLDGVPMVMYAIAPYQNDAVYGERVRKKLEEGVAYIAGNLSSDYTLRSWGTENSEVISWTICALSAAGVDPYTDPRFGDGTKSILSQWLNIFAVSNGFKHTSSDPPGSNKIATYEGCYALQWYLKFLDNGGAGHPCHLWYQRYDFSKKFSGEADILSFQLEGKQAEITGTSITLTLPAGTPLTNVTPKLTLSDGAELTAPQLPITFAAGVAQPFTVTAEDGETQKTYSVTVNLSAGVQASGAELFTNTIKLQDKNQRDITLGDLQVTKTDHGADIVLTVGFGVDTAQLRIAADISYKATASPALDGKAAVDLSDWTVFTVTSEDGANICTYRIKVQAKRKAAIASFTLTIDGKPYEGTIDNTADTITVSGVDDSNLTTTQFTPAIVMAEGTVVCQPLPTLPQDFSKPVLYTVTGDGENIAARTYTVTVTNQSGGAITVKSGSTTTPAAAPQITGFKVPGSLEVKIDQSTGVITVRMPQGSRVWPVSPAVTISSGCTVNPSDGAAVNLQGAAYVVSNGTEEKNYQVQVIFVRTIAQQLWDKLYDNLHTPASQVSRAPSGLSGKR